MPKVSRESMRCFRSILNVIQSLNNKDQEETNSILKKKKPSKAGRLLEKHKTESDFCMEANCGPRKDCYRGLQCVSLQHSNCYPFKASCEQRTRMNRADKCDKRPANRFNLAKLQWIKNSFALDPFPDFKYNTTILVNRGYQKLFKLVNVDHLPIFYSH